MITKIPSSQDIRQVKIANKKCFKISKIYFQNVLAVSAENNLEQPLDNGPEVAAENFVDICIQDAKLEELYYESENKI